jgi:hypothetical protein
MASVELFRATLEREYYAEPVAPPAGATLFDLVTWERSAAIDPRAVLHWTAVANGSRGGEARTGALNRLPSRLFARTRTRAWSTRAIEPATLSRIEQFARRNAATPALALVGGIYAALARLADADDPTALVMIEKRDRAELRELFTNLTAIMPCRVAGAREAVPQVAARVAAQLLEGAEHTDPLMRHPTLWNDFWAGSPRAARILERVLPERAAQYIRALVPLERKRDRLMFVINVLPEVGQSHAGERITRARELPHMLVPTDLVTGADALLDRTLQVHVTNAGGVAVHLYGGGLSQAGLDEINDRIASALGELA